MTQNKIKRDPYDCLAIIRANLLLTENLLNELKTNSDFKDPEFAKANFELRRIVDKRLKNAIAKESIETQATYLELAEKLVKSLNETAQLQFMDEIDKEKSKDGSWFVIEYQGEKCYAQYSQGCYWLARHTIGLNEPDIKVIGEMVK